MVPFVDKKLDLFDLSSLLQDQIMSNHAPPESPPLRDPEKHATQGPPTERTRVRRGPRKARYGSEEIKAILDAAWLCHLSLISPRGAICIPTIYARMGDELLVHGSAKSGLLSQLVGQRTCVVVSIVDGIVLARSAMHHSVNYRSVVLYAQAREISEESEKRHALDLIVDHLLPGRSKECRAANPVELNATSVYALDINEASAKIRTGPPNDERADLDGDYWAGVIPVHTQPGQPIAAPDLRPGVELPLSLDEYQLPHQRMLEGI